jgi:hypothetical protein
VSRLAISLDNNQSIKSWVGAGKKYVPTQTSVNTQKQVVSGHTSSVDFVIYLTEHQLCFWIL